jgi:predicted secreted Zn-dependent protease
LRLSSTLVGSIFAGLVLLMGITYAGADVRVKTTTTYYHISGTDGRALNDSMLQGGKTRIKLSHAIAATETELDFQEPKIIVENGRCVVKDVDVVLNIRYIFPKWSGKAGASREVRKRWNAFWRELKRHEENHGEIAKAGAERLEKALLGIRSFAINGCAGFSQIAAVNLRQILRQTEAAQRNFDRVEYGNSSRISQLQRMLYESR